MIHTERLRNAMARHGRAAAVGERKHPDEGTISALDETNQAAKVILQPSGAETGWIPLKTPWAGDGWGMFSPPTLNQTVTVEYENGDMNSPHVGLKSHNDVDKPLACPGGEFWLVHKSGSFLKLQNDGTAQIKGDLYVNGDVYDKHGSLDRLRQNYDAHLHPGVLHGTQSTDPTDHPDSESTTPPDLGADGGASV